MASHISFVISGLLLMIITIVVQSIPIPIDKTKEIFQVPSINDKQAVKQLLLKSVASIETSSDSTSTTTSPTTTVSQISSSSSSVLIQEKNNKKKRYINDDDDQFEELSNSESNENDDKNSYQLAASKLDNKINHALHAKMQETSAKIHDNADKPVNIDDSKVFSDIQMTPNELTDIVRRRRDVKLNVESNQRRKRALSPYDFYDTDSFYNPFVDVSEGHQYVRPVRSFAPIYWYPSVYERNIRAALEPSFYESSRWPKLYSSNIDNDESDENPSSIFDDEDEDDYELNRYPILLEPSNNLFDNLQLQQQYNTDDLPTEEDFEENLNDDDDDDGDDNHDDDEQQYRPFYRKERPYYTRYGYIDRYV